MESIAKTLNAAKEIELDGKKYKLSSVDLNDLAAFENHLKRQRIKDACDSGMDKKDIREMVAQINREGVSPDELQDRINTMSGIRFLIWRCVVKHDPEVTEEYIGEKIDLQNMAEVINEAMDMPEGEEDAEGEQGEKKT